MKYTETINQLILNRKLIEDQLDKKTWKNFEAYRLSHEHNDVRYDYILRLIKKWPGGSLEDWLLKCPLSWITPKGDEFYIDYGKNKNSVLFQNRNLFISNPDLAYEYKMFHTPENDHCPTPKSKKGQNVFSNCEVVPKYANQASLDVPLDDIIDAAELMLAVYSRIKDKVNE